jgi:hypothetical protein
MQPLHLNATAGHCIEHEPAGEAQKSEDHPAPLPARRWAVAVLGLSQ